MHSPLAMSKLRGLILIALHQGAVADWQLCRAVFDMLERANDRQIPSLSSVRTRRKELVDMGYVDHVGWATKGHSKTRHRVWGLTTVGLGVISNLKQLDLWERYAPKEGGP